MADRELRPVNKAAYGPPDLTEFGVEDLDERGERPTPLPVPPELRHRLRTAPYLCMPQAKSVRLHPNHLQPRSPLATSDAPSYHETPARTATQNAGAGRELQSRPTVPAVPKCMPLS